METDMNSLKIIPHFCILFIFLNTILLSQESSIRIACVGNSITHGGYNSQSYPQQLAKLLGSGYNVQNFGISGTTMLKKGDMPYWNQQRYWDAKDFNPHILLIMLGTNDSKPQNWAYGEEFYGDYMDMISDFRKDGKDPIIFLAFPPPAFKILAGITNSVIHDQIIPLIDSVHTSANTLTIDYYNYFLPHPELFPDGVHPNSDGYKIMAEFASESILNIPSGQIITFTSDTAFAELNEKITIRWRTSTESLVTLDGQTVNPIDSMDVTITEDTKFTLTSTGELSDKAEVLVQFIPPGKIKSFYANPFLLEKSASDTCYLVWNTSSGSIVTLDGQAVNTNDSVAVSPSETTTYTLISRGAKNDTSTVTVELLDADKLNRAYKRKTSTSTNERGYYGDLAVDGDLNTAWISGNQNSVWISVDMGKDINVNRVKINWGHIYAVTYQIQLLSESGTTSVVYVTTKGDGEIDDVTGLSGKGRYLRLVALKRSSTDSGYILKEFEIFGTLNPTTIEYSHDWLIPLKNNLAQNYPNPFNPSTTIEYSISINLNTPSAHVSLVVYDVLGRQVDTLVDENKSNGRYQVVFDGNKLSSGIYFYKLSAGSYTQTNKMILVQ